MAFVPRKRWEMDRRFFLRCGAGGVGTLLGLPLLNAMMPRLAHAGYNGSTAPVRYLAIYAPHGTSARFFPTGFGRGSEYSLADTVLGGLQENKSYLGFIQNAQLLATDAWGHQSNCFLSSRVADEGTTTGNKTVDQEIADVLAAQGYQGRRSLHLAGYSTWGQSGLSMRDTTTKNPHQLNPRVVFDSLVQGMDLESTAEQALRRRQRRQSVLDFVKGDLARLDRNGIGREDKMRVEQYLSGVRENARFNNGIILAGRGGGAINPDFNMSLTGGNLWLNPPSSRLANVHLACLRAMGGTQTQFADSSGIFNMQTAQYETL